MNQNFKEEIEKLQKANYIVWKYYGYEGWSPTPIEKLDDLIDEVSSTASSQFLITKGGLQIEINELKT